MNIHEVTLSVGFYTARTKDKEKREWLAFHSVANLRLSQLVPAIKDPSSNLRLENIALIASSEDREVKEEKDERGEKKKEQEKKKEDKDKSTGKENEEGKKEKNDDSKGQLDVEETAVVTADKGAEGATKAKDRDKKDKVDKKEDNKKEGDKKKTVIRRSMATRKTNSLHMLVFLNS